MTEQSAVSILWVSFAHLFKAAYPLPQLSRTRSISTSSLTCSETSFSTTSLSTDSSSTDSSSTDLSSTDSSSTDSSSTDSSSTDSSSTDSLSTGSSLDSSITEEDILEQTSSSESTETNLSMKIIKQLAANEHHPLTKYGSPCTESHQAPSEHHPPTKSPNEAKTGLRERLFSLFKKAVPSKEECTGCDKQIKPGRLIIAPCSHRYCQHCIHEMAHIALKNTGRFPVRCCLQEIPARQVAATLPSEERETYTSRSEEHNVPPAERWYCPQTKCGQWIRPRYLKQGSRAPKCPHCKTSICAKCRDIAHEDRRCESDPKLAEILKVARRHRWQRCYNCHAMVEKTGGCNHMKCTCLAEFCYSCTRRWPCRCRGTTEVVEDAARLEADPDFDTTMVVAAMEQAEREVAEDTVIQQQNVRQREQTLRLQEQRLRQMEQQAVRLQEQVMRHVEDFMSRRTSA